MKRRSFLGAATTLAISAAAGSSAAHAAPGTVDAGTGKGANALADHLIGSHPRRTSLAAIGEAYWQDGPNDAVVCPGCLSDAVQALLRHLDLSEPDLRQMPPAAVITRIRTGTAIDFAEGRIIPVGGWLLGETEARLCAIAALRRA